MKLTAEIEAAVRSEGAPAGTCPTTWAWDTEDPLVVRVTFQGNDGPDGPSVTWVWSRADLATGTVSPTALNDVVIARRFEPTGEVLRVLLSSPDGKATAVFNARRVDAFLKRTENLVPLDAGYPTHAEWEAWAHAAYDAAHPGAPAGWHECEHGSSPNPCPICSARGGRS